MLYSLLWYRTRIVHKESRWGAGEDEIHRWDEEETAFGETQYFTEQRFAQNWAQRYIADPLDWVPSGEFLSTDHEDFHFQIETKNVDVNPWDTPAPPNKFRSSPSHGD